jgi:catechol 2,3-dioxygenase-like lactoylglutathione lyase family enzyme
VLKLAQLALLVRDYDEAIAWYARALGFRCVEDTPLGAGKRWVVMRPPGPGGADLLLARAVNAEQESRVGNQTGGRVFLFLHSDDFWRDHDAFAARGVKFVVAPHQEEYGIAAVFEDLYGNRWDLIGGRAAAR